MFKFSQLLPILGLLSAVIVCAQAKGYYTITSPGSIRPNSKYSVHVSVSDVWYNSRILLTLQGPQYKKLTELVVPPNSGQSATFQLGDITNGVYSLKAQSLSGIIFENSTNLEFVENLPMVYLQTDKALYRSGDTINFRAIFLDQYLLPAKVNQPLTVVLKDSNNVVIERFDDIVLNTGVYKGAHKLADRVVSDEWTVQVFLGRQILAKKIIEVQDYELPPFEVDLDIPTHVSLKDKEFIVRVRARYDVNSPVSGRCVITILRAKNVAIKMAHGMIDCNKGIPVNLSRLGRISKDVIVNVTVEDNTKNVRIVSRTVKIVPNLYVLNMPSMSYECHELGEVFVYRAHIYNYNGNPIDVDDDVSVTLNPGTNGVPETYVSHVNDEGYLDVQIKCSNYNTVYVSINYEGMQKSGKILLKYRNQQRMEGIHVNAQFPKLNNPMEVRLVSHEPFTSFVCVIVGRGDIVHSNIIEVPNGEWVQRHKFSVTPTYEMMPEAHMLVYFIKNGNMFYFETTFAVKSEFQTTISLYSPENIKPGVVLSLSAFTEPNSYVGLLAVDIDTLRLPSENGLNAQQIFHDISNVQKKTSGDITELAVMTNAKCDLGKTHKAIATEKVLNTKHIRARNYFETFAFIDYVSVTGYDEVIVKLPSTFFKTWIITAFAISPTTGFALTTSMAMKTLKELHIDMELPHQVRKVFHHLWCGMVKLSQLLPLLGLLSAIIVCAQAKGYYTITSPGSIRPNSKYSVHVSVSDVLVDSKIGLTLIGPQYNKFTELMVPPNTGQSVTFELGDITNGAYTLKAQGLAGIIFENSTNLEFVENLPMVYLQTDKALYKFGDTIQFRAIFLDQYLLPAKVNQPISVVLKDSHSNVIERFDDVVLNIGVYKGKLKLAEEVIAGEWSVQAFLGQNMLAKKIIEVKHYDLPLFEVNVEMPSYVSLRDRLFLIKVEAHYTFGKPIFGTCALAYSASRNNPVQRQFNLQDGRIEIPINIRDFGARLRPLPITIEVADAATQTSRKISKTINIVGNHYEISTPDVSYECSEKDDTFFYRAYISQYNRKAINNDREVYVTLNMREKDVVTNETLLTYPDVDGSVDVEIICGNYANINVTIKYDNAQSTGVIQLYHQNEGAEGGIYVKTQFPTVNEPLELRLISPETFSSFVCMIVGRGNIVYSNVFEIPNGGWSQAHTFSVTPTHEMMPEAHIFAYFFKNGKLIYYETTFSVTNQFKNTISIDAPEVVKPGTFTSLQIDTEPNSYVGLLGVDKSVLLLKSGNDFSAKAIFDDLQKVKSKISGRHGPGVIAGLATMTNAHYIEHTTVGENELVNQLGSKPIVRRNFFETFAFVDFVSEDGHDELQQKIPDTVTTWVITGFSLNPKTGFTLTTTPTQIRTFLYFFVTLKLPHSVKLGEIIELEATVFNYLRTNVHASITLERQNDEFEFFSNPNHRSSTIEAIVRKDRTQTVKFKIRPKVVGMITLKVSAHSRIYGSDVLVKQLKVEHEGITVWNNVDFYINGDESKALQLNIPQNIVHGSERIEITVMDFIMGSMLNLINNGEDFDKLITSPTGCGEQNMIRVVPNLMVLKYLQSTSTSNNAIDKLARSYLRTGYQRELTYKVSDHSFSTWGSAPGNTWLTAYVVRIFNEAKAYITVDENVIKNGLAFLSSKQQVDGSFREDGSLYDFVTLNKLSVTASVTLTFLENKQYLAQYKAVIDNGIKYIRENVKQTDDMRAKALSLYVLHLRKDPMVEELLDILEAKARTSGDHKWWQYAEAPANIDVYVTGYILITMMEMNRPVTPIIKWLVSKRNSNGGFSSTFETEVGLRALSIYAARYREHDGALDIDVYSRKQLVHTFKVGENSKDINKKIKLPENTRDLQFTAVGSGKATFQISYRYNTLEPYTDVFSLNSTITDPTAPSRKLQVCMQLIGQKIEKSNMAILEINLPTSDEVGPDCCAVKLQKQAKKIVRKSKQQIHVYFEGVKRDDSDCVEIPTMKQFDVDNLKPAYITIYDYYEKDSVDKYEYKV